jgi:uncharacterized phage protein (TIGR02220 family)
MVTEILAARVLRSQKVEAIGSFEAERLYYRMLLAADQLGRLKGGTKAIAAACFPSKAREIETECELWLAELIRAGLVTVREGERGTQVQIVDPLARHDAAQAVLPIPEMASPPKAKVASPLQEAARRVLAFLNEKAGRAFEPCEPNIGLIIARIKEGATEEKLRQVVVRKCREWKGTEMEKYLRPKTLFNRTNFAQYVGELVPRLED